METPFFVDVSSSGYLEDIIGGWRNQVTTCSHNFMLMDEENWDDKVEDFLDFTSMEMDFIDDRYFLLSKENSSSEETQSGNCVIDQEHQQEEENHDSPSSSSRGACMAFMDSNLLGNGALNSSQMESKKIAYPFDMTKRGGTEGYVTLEDINHHIFMPPTRPIKHPVGDFATRSRVSTSGFSLSGRVVIAHTKIYTQGSGSITVIRTRS